MHAFSCTVLEQSANKFLALVLSVCAFFYAFYIRTSISLLVFSSSFCFVREASFQEMLIKRVHAYPTVVLVLNNGLS